MKTHPHRSVRPALALALCAGLLCPLAAHGQLGAPADGALTPGAAGERGIEHAIAAARRQMSHGELIAARETLKQALSAEGSMLAGPAVSEALELHKEVQRAIRQADAVEMALQKARAAMETGNLAEADLHLDGAAQSGEASEAQAARIESLRTEVGGRRAELAPVIPQALSQAVAEFEAGRYAEAKAGFTLVRRSGVSLDEKALATLDSYQTRLLALEEARGSAFAPAPGALSLLQPGVVTEQDEPAQQPQQEEPRQPQTPDDIIAMAQAAEAQAQLRQADIFFDDGRYSEAVRLYRNLRTAGLMQYLTEEERARAQAREDEALVRMGRPAAGQDPIEVFVGERDAQRENARAEFNNALRLAQRALQAGDFNGAEDAVQRARLRLEGARGLFAESELNELRRRAEEILQQAQASRREAELVAQVEQDRIRREQATRTQEETRRTRERVVNELIDQIRAFQREQRYAEALDAVDRLLNVDPRNPSGLLLRDVLGNVMLYMDYEDAVRYKQRAINRLAVDNERAAAPSPDLVNYPVNWPSITLRRGGGSTQFIDSPQNRATLDSLERPFTALAFEDHSLEQALGAVQQIRGDLNFDIEWGALEAIGISRDTPLTLRLPEVPTHVALDRILSRVSDDDFSKADWAVIDGIVTVSSDERIRRHRRLFIYDMRDLLHEVPDYDEVPDIDLQNVLQGQQGGGGGQSPFRDDQQNQELDRRPLEERLQDIEELISELVDPTGWEVNGGDTGKMYQYGGSLVIVNTPANHREISGLLGQLREQRAMQINVEARFLLVNQDFFERVGMDLDVYINTNNAQVRELRATDPTLQGRDFFDFTQPRNPLRTVSGGGTDPTAQAVPAPRGFSPIGFSQNSFGLVESLSPTSGVTGEVLGASPALGIAGQFLDDIQVDFLVEATQADRRSIQLTAPRLTFTNGQVANIYVATQQAFVSDLEPVVGDSAIGFDPEVAVVSEGVTLLVDGTISADRRYVQLNVDTGIARIDGFAQQAVTAVAGGELVDSSETASFISLPTVTVTRVQTTVSVPDQGTVLLGGQRLITEFEVETGVPVLSKLPILSRFFSNRLESKEEQTLLILIKPTVLIQSEQEEQNYPGLLDSAGIGFGG
jgi:Flp pilus assembly secretin CpaC/tetratricopeptide (TPR) repeat protein